MSHPWARLDRRRRARLGTAAVEFALIVTPLFLLLFGIIEFGRMMWTESSLHFAVEEAARCASVTPGTCGTSAQTAAYAAAEISFLSIPSSAFTATTASCGHQVTASYTYRFIVSGLFPYTPALGATACFP